MQYYSPWFRWLSANTKLQLRVFYLWEFGVTEQRDPQFETAFKWDVDLLAGYDSEFVPNTARDPGTHHFRGLINPTLTARLRAWQPTAVLLFGYNWHSHQRALWWARWCGLPLLFRGDSHLLGRGLPSLGVQVALRVLFRQFRAFLCVGSANRAYFRALGVPESRLFLAPHSVNHEHFDPAVPETQSAAHSLRAELGLVDRRVVLFAGKFNERKQPVELLHAFLAVTSANDALVFVGDGPLRGDLQAIASQNPQATVRFLPFANQSEMPARYLLADIFALPSRGFYETWGLAVNEAMHLGTPCLVSDLVGCQQDLVKPGETGWVFHANDRADLAAVLRTALQTPPEEMSRLRRNLATTIQNFTYEQTSAGLVRALSSLPAR